MGGKYGNVYAKIKSAKIKRNVGDIKMPIIQFNIPDELDKRIKHYMIDHSIKKKSEAIIKMLDLTTKR